jgi:hypothetical protein
MEIKMFELSICIPARSEEFLPQTVEDLLAHTSDKTEVIVGLDGYDIELPAHPRLRVHKEPESIGQRAMQNKLVGMSTAKYVAKTDAHCAFDEDFDTKMLARMEDDITLVPVMRNLHIFDWVCDFCEWRGYQGPQPESCPECQSDAGHIHKQIIWNPKTNPQSSAYRFNKNLQFKYFPELRAKLPKQGLQETMSLQGSFFMCSRAKYWDLKLCDEAWGSWGQQGSEVALKTWLSGGRVLCNFDTWYGHLFRTQAGFSFPYPMNGNDQDRARKISRELFLNDQWDQAIRPLSWLLQKFWFALKDVTDPEAKWTEADLADYQPPPSRAIIYYTAHRKSLKISRAVQNRLKQIAAQKDIPITSCSLKPMDKMGANIHLPLEAGQITYFTQVITALRHCSADIVYLCEDDALYHPSHFDYVPADDKFHYDLNWWRVRPDGFAAHWDANQVSGLVARREPLLAWYRAKYEQILKKGFDRSYEPGARDPDSYVQFRSAAPYIDLRTGNTMTKDKWSLADFRDKSSAANFQTSTIENIPGWRYDELRKLIEN